MRRSLVLIASIALLLPAAVLTGPADAVEANHESYVVRHCSTAKSGVTLRIKFRVDKTSNGRIYRIRISHPNGTGRFEEHRVKHTLSSLTYGGADPDGALYAETVPDRAVFRGHGRGPDTFDTRFKLRNGKTADLECKSPLR